jgi:phenylacetate-CoA ligase
MEERIIDNILYLNTKSNPNNWTRDDLLRMVAEIDEYRPELLDAAPAFLVVLVERCHRMNIALPRHRPRVISLDYEMVTSWQLRRIQRTFRVPVVNLHGTTELGCLFFQETNGFRRCPDLSLVEFQPFCERRRTYEVIVTSVKNPLMPFVRYRIGDVVQLMSDGAASPDSSVALICGRARDAVPGRGGDLVTAGEIDAALGAIENDIILYQVVFLSYGQMLFKYTTPDDAQLSAVEAAEVTAALRSVLGAHVNVELVREHQIFPELSGKFTTLAGSQGRL